MDFIELLKVIFLGIVEGITEWLPVSSTGHLILVEEFIKLNVSEAFWEMFMVVIQLGAIMAVVVLYFKKLWPFQNQKKEENIEITLPYRLEQGETCVVNQKSKAISKETVNRK